MPDTGTVGGRPVAVVTGASRGLGFLLARELLRRGHDLVVCARSVAELAEAGADWAREGGRVVTVVADIGVKADAERVVARAVEEFGRLDVLVANAGTIQVGPVPAMRTSDFEDALDTMFWGVVHPTLAALPLLGRAGPGRVLIVTSLGGKVPAPHLLPYTAAKHAAVGFAEGLRVEAGRYGVTVTTAVPGLMRTGSTSNAMFGGDPRAEHRWFAIADSLPLLSMDAEVAARRLVDAALRGTPEVILTPAAKIAARVHGIAPNLTLRLLAVGERLLPGGAAPATKSGHAVGSDRPWLRLLTTTSRRAARSLHQHEDQGRATREFDV